MNRAERRAAERKANKLANKSASQSSSLPAVVQPELPSPPSPPIMRRASPARLAANQANSQLSTGPRTPEGKAKVSLNAVKTALTGQPFSCPPTTPSNTNSSSPDI